MKWNQSFRIYMGAISMVKIKTIFIRLLSVSLSESRWREINELHTSGSRKISDMAESEWF